MSAAHGSSLKSRFSAAFMARIAARIRLARQDAQTISDIACAPSGGRVRYASLGTVGGIGLFKHNLIRVFLPIQWQGGLS
jgi:hypothetical protein